MATLTDKIVLVTGASSGIGRATAIRFSQAGTRVIVAARRDERLRELARALPNPSHVLKLDVRDRNEVDLAIAGLPPEWRDIDILVNNAGLSRDLSKLHEGRPESWEEMIDTNIKGLLWVSRAVTPRMVARGRGHVINIGSIAGHEVYPGGNVYCASKFAVDALTKGLRMDLVDTPVRVTTVDPGMVETEFSDVRFYGDKERAKKVYSGITPLTGDDVADAIVWAATRPENVQIAQVVILPSAQASAMVAHRK
ncbi:MAG: SDR family oxidoreductase [Candidatus Zixiibacteriota bacterium]